LLPARSVNSDNEYQYFDMSNTVTGAIKHAVMGHKNDKIDQLKANMVEPSENTRITSDFGVKQNNTDQWLRVATEDQTGPSLLEDTFGREKVCGATLDIALAS